MPPPPRPTRPRIPLPILVPLLIVILVPLGAAWRKILSPEFAGGPNRCAMTYMNPAYFPVPGLNASSNEGNYAVWLYRERGARGPDPGRRDGVGGVGRRERVRNSSVENWAIDPGAVRAWQRGVVPAGAQRGVGDRATRGRAAYVPPNVVAVRPSPGIRASRHPETRPSGSTGSRWISTKSSARFTAGCSAAKPPLRHTRWRRYWRRTHRGRRWSSRGTPWGAWWHAARCSSSERKGLMGHR